MFFALILMFCIVVMDPVHAVVFHAPPPPPLKFIPLRRMAQAVSAMSKRPTMMTATTRVRQNPDQRAVSS
jgi:hypothetical protein